MKKLKGLIATLSLALSVSSVTTAGEMQAPTNMSSPPPIAGEMQTPTNANGTQEPSPDWIDEGLSISETFMLELLLAVL